LHGEILLARISLERAGICEFTRSRIHAFTRSPKEGVPVFNKSTLFNRNDALPRRDAASAPAVSARPAGAAAENAAARPAVPAREVSAPPAPAAPPAAQAAPPAPNEWTGPDQDTDSGLGARLIVGPDVKLKGAEILDCDTLVVEGRVEATMDSRVIRIAEHGAFVGKVSIDIAEIHGSFEGELTARSQLIIHSTGRVTGTIRYGKLVADEGCELCGDINVLSSGPVPKAKASIAERAEPLVVLNGAAS
jgi:cytoskeletal protein CcmA (bactofilin family)